MTVMGKDELVASEGSRLTLREGADCQAVMDACVVSSNERRWVDVSYPSTV